MLQSPAYHPSNKAEQVPPIPKDLHRQLFFTPKLQLMHTVREDHFVIFGLTCRSLELRRLEITRNHLPSYHGLLPSCRLPIELHPCYAKSIFLKQKLNILSRPDHLGSKAVRDDRPCRVFPTYKLLHTVRQLSLDRTEATKNALISPNCHTT